MRRWLIPAAIVAAVIVAFACGENLQIASVGSSEDCDACADAAGDADSTSLPDAESCDGAAYNLAGCRCTTAGERASCSQGVPGAKSACNEPGTQDCATGADGKLRWTPCNGGSKPSGNESCFDDRDDDCDGKLNQGCLCSDFVDLCKRDADAGAPMFDPKEPFLYAIPATPKAGVPFDLVIVTKGAPLQSPGLKTDGVCTGADRIKSCASPGAGCTGWSAAVFHEVKLPAGPHTFLVVDPGALCEGSVIAALNVDVAP